MTCHWIHQSSILSTFAASSWKYIQVREQKMNVNANVYIILTGIKNVFTHYVNASSYMIVVETQQSRLERSRKPFLASSWEILHEKMGVSKERSKLSRPWRGIKRGNHVDYLLPLKYTSGRDIHIFWTNERKRGKEVLLFRRWGERRMWWLAVGKLTAWPHINLPQNKEPLTDKEKMLLRNKNVIVKRSEENVFCG